MTQAEELELEVISKVLRKDIRRKAGLKLDWNKCSVGMKEWYRQQAIKCIEERIDV